jgi:hypothetical protein
MRPAPSHHRQQRDQKQRGQTPRHERTPRRGEEVDAVAHRGDNCDSGEEQLHEDRLEVEVRPRHWQRPVAELFPR